MFWYVANAIKSSKILQAFAILYLAIAAFEYEEVFAQNIMTFAMVLMLILLFTQCYIISNFDQIWADRDKKPIPGMIEIQYRTKLHFILRKCTFAGYVALVLYFVGKSFWWWATLTFLVVLFGSMIQDKIDEKKDEEFKQALNNAT